MSGLIPGEIRTAPGNHDINTGRETRVLVVTNDGDRPVQIGSHFHFADVNTALDFDRTAAVGFRLGVPAGTAVRFEPGASREVMLVRLAGTGTVPGLQIHDGGSSSAHAPGTES
ncbi:urease subunit beta [Arthrobacter gengyunqii]|uniref:Urease subunit beta n=1 Tax=Arthrobacter gengyunqii TaxID=2886940 RepID=A0A9X1M3S0_9MICC|nr:urease subunit beta [Arthrobacter gengyunqii]MCC3270270.1 urease subunit beta [Arthrobacter gengyunqii]MCC3271019.1 urease subunit beta [Arthrobacter gengyunqii]UOY96974.1 urease subunit beta [Arthrobacter gengyunqii]